MPLLDHWNSLSDELTKVSAEFLIFAANHHPLSAASHFTYSDECLLEGLLSRTWQAWVGFCRLAICDSCVGSVSGNGMAIAPVPGALSEAHVSSAAIKAKKASAAPPYWGSTNSLLRIEPTWGDADVLATIIPRLAPSNQSQLLASFSSGHAYSKMLQKIRNASAHLNHQTMAEVMTLSSSYVVFPILHPTQALFWVDPTSKDYLLMSAIEKIAEAGLDAIS